MRIAILYICTGKYNVFWKEFYTSFQEKFLPQSEKDYFVFTDDDKLYAHNENNVNIMKHKFMGWPYDTLMRFEVFSRVEEQLRSFDYIFFFNANMICNQVVNETEFLRLEDPDIKLIMVQHPGVYNRKARYVPYCRDAHSTAYIPYNKGEKYVMGALNGGKAEAYLQLIKRLRENTQIDLDNNVIATVHDESHLNWYVLGTKDVYIHTPEYCNAEAYPDLPFEKKIIMLDKSRFFDVAALKGADLNKEIILEKFLRKLRKYVKCNTHYYIDLLSGKKEAGRN